MKEFNAKKIIVKYLVNEATPQETEKLLRWVGSKKNEKIFKEFVQAHQLSNIAYNSSEVQTAFDDFLRQIRTSKSKSNFRIKRFVRYFKYAAVIVGVLLSTLYLLKKENHVSPFVEMTDQVTLQLINGDKQYFNIDTDKTIKTKTGHEVAIVENGVLTYVAEPTNRKNKPLQNILKVPYGKTFNVVLSDGSSILLNSGSLLKYPNVFIKNEPREVFLEGEAFFQVTTAPNSSFIVNSKNSITKVYGTEFNVSCYSEDDKTEIVLVEGSVGVKTNSSIKGQENYQMMIPSQKASLSSNSEDVEITTVNIQKYISWKEGILTFENEKFETIQKTLERHYNVKIINNFHDINSFRYNGTFKNDSIEKILNTIKTHTNFSFQRKDEIITINNPKNPQ
ncbi:FecR family protein [Gelidibacter maritimus]|uniref:FecR family protein n=1 Tax=Gelidibacter maritimus TaxID=2761487 RepID=A0A7W2M3I5_9FLAO|nr:FecR family protein [Gelidibacter maritimus]MBA6152030.1 FecR family protein [Gelidibacter maritimus]